MTRVRIGRAPGFVAAAGLALACGADPAVEPAAMPQADGLDFERVAVPAPGDVAPLERYPTRAGGSLSLRRYGDAHPLALVLVHGSGYHGSYLAGLAREIAAAGIAQVLTPDLRGHGVDPDRRGDVDYVDQLEDDLADLVAYAEDALGAKRVVVGGHSSGGGLAVRFAGSQYGERAAGYVLLAPYLGHDAPTTRENSGGWAAPRVGRIVGLSILNGFGITAWNDATVITFAMPESVRDGTETLAYSYRLNTGYAPRAFASDLRAVDRPFLALIGRDDEAFHADALAPTLEGVRADVGVIDGVGHLDITESPEVRRRLADWLRALSRDG